MEPPAPDGVSSSTAMASRFTSSIERRGIEFVPLSERRGTVIGQLRFWFFGNLTLFTAALGFVGPALGLGFVAAALALVTGSLLGAVVIAAHACQGPRVGMPQLTASRRQFGRFGNVLFAVVPVVNTVIGAGVSLTVVGHGVHEVLDVPVALVTAAMMLGALSLATYGHHAMHAAARVVLWVSIPAYALLTFLAGTSDAPVAMQSSGDTWPAVLAVLTVAASYNVAFAPHASDFTRYLSPAVSRPRLFLAVLVGSWASSAWLTVLGAWIASSGGGDPLSQMWRLGDASSVVVGGSLLAFFVVSVAVSQSIGVYSSGLIITAVAESLRVAPRAASRVALTVLSAAASLVIATVIPGDYLPHMESLLRVGLILTVPWSAVILVDHYLLRPLSGRPEDLSWFTMAPSWGIGPLVAYVTGAGITALFARIGTWEGPASGTALGGDLAFVVGYAAAAAMTAAVEVVRRQRANAV